MEQQTQFLTTIDKIWRNYDKNQREYLVVKTDKEDSRAKDGKVALFLFDQQEKWDELIEGQKYNFEAVKSNSGNWKIKEWTKL